MKILTLIVCVGLVFTGCKKDNIPLYASQGTLLGYDRGYCPNCGGLEISIKNDTSKNAPVFYRIDTTLTQLGFNEKTPFPIEVTLDWKHDPAIYGGGYIIVNRIKIVK